MHKISCDCGPCLDEKAARRNCMLCGIRCSASYSKKSVPGGFLCVDCFTVIDTNERNFVTLEPKNYTVGLEDRMTYDQLFWRFVYSSDYDEAKKLFEHLMNKVHLGMSPIGPRYETWVSTPDPHVIVPVKTSKRPAFNSIMLLINFVIITVGTLVFFGVI